MRQRLMFLYWLLPLFFSVSSFAATELVYPWLTNNSLFRGTMVVNNLGENPASVLLTAVRASGESEETIRTIEPFSQLVEGTASLFPDLGEGSGYAVFLTSDGDDLTGAFVVEGTDTSSGSSPAQANVVAASEAHPIILFSYLPIPENPPADSAPVVVNMGTSDATVTLHAYQAGARIGTVTLDVGPRRPFAQVTSALFPGSSGGLFVVAESNQPLQGMAFIFNDAREPSMANAVAIAQVPDPDSNPPDPTVFFAQDIDPIFRSFCALGGCHASGSEQEGLNLDVGRAYDDIVNVPSRQEPSLMRVLPGDAEASYLYRKVDPTLPNSGSQMPRARPPLTQQQLDLIRTWINEGALNN